MKTQLFVLGLVAAILPTAAAQEKTRKYVDPGKTFTIEIPAGWTATREKFGTDELENHFITLFVPTGEDIVRIAVLVAEQDTPLPAVIAQPALEELSRGNIGGWVAGMKQHYKGVKAGEIGPGKVGQRNAAQCIVTYAKGDKFDPRRGLIRFVCGRRHSYLISVGGPAANAAGFRAAEAALATLQLEPRQ